MSDEIHELWLDRYVRQTFSRITEQSNVANGSFIKTRQARASPIPRYWRLSRLQTYCSTCQVSRRDRSRPLCGSGAPGWGLPAAADASGSAPERRAVLIDLKSPSEQSLLELAAILDGHARAQLLDQANQDAERCQLTRVQQQGIMVDPLIRQPHSTSVSGRHGRSDNFVVLASHPHADAHLAALARDTRRNRSAALNAQNAICAAIWYTGRIVDRAQIIRYWALPVL